MGFFKDIGEGFLNSGKWVLAPFNKARDVGMSFMDHAGSAANTAADHAGKAAGNVFDGIGGFASLFSNPLMWVAVGVGAFVILPKILK